MKPRKNRLLWILIIIISLGIMKFSFSSWMKYNLWQAHKAYFESNKDTRKAEKWMSINFIERHFNVEFDEVSTAKIGFWEARKPLDEVCKSHQINCTVLLSQLNEKIRPQKNSGDQ